MAVHYFETTKRVRQDSRWDLAAAMAELSRMHTIAGANTLIPQEVDAVAARIYRDQIDPNAPDPSPIEPFGVDAAHALGAPPGTFAGQFSFEELRAAGMPEDMLTLVRRGLVDATELAVLARTESSEQARKIAEQTREQMGEVDQKFADHQRAFAEHVKDNRLTHRRDEGLSRFDLADIRELILRACVARGFVLTPEQFGDTETVERLLKEVPSKWAVRRVRHRNVQQSWTASDLNDINALSGAVVYCDIVVTERQWAHHLNKEGLPQLHGTTVISDLKDLTGLLVAHSTN